MVSINNAPATEMRVGGLLLKHTRNEIQKWLLSMQWRRIPEGKDDIFIYPNDRIEKDGYMALIGKGESHV